MIDRELFDFTICSTRSLVDKELVCNKLLVIILEVRKFLFLSLEKSLVDGIVHVVPQMGCNKYSRKIADEAGALSSREFILVAMR